MAELRRKALIYLDKGAQLVWIVNPMKRIAEVCRLDEADQLKIDLVDIDGKLDGEGVLPGFELELRQLFKS